MLCSFSFLIFPFTKIRDGLSQNLRDAELPTTFFFIPGSPPRFFFMPSSPPRFFLNYIKGYGTLFKS